MLSKGQDVWEVTTNDVFGMCPFPSLLLVQVKWFIKFLFIGAFLGHLCILLLVVISVISTVFLYFSCFSDHMSSSLCGHVLPWGSYADSKTGASRACALPASQHAANSSSKVLNPFKHPHPLTVLCCCSASFPTINIVRILEDLLNSIRHLNVLLQILFKIFYVL